MYRIDTPNGLKPINNDHTTTLEMNHRFNQIKNYILPSVATDEGVLPIFYKQASL